MPEIWLRYGGTHVVLDIKFENLLRQLSSNTDLLNDEEVRAKLSGVSLKESTLILVIDGSRSVAKVIDIILQMNKSIDPSKISIEAISEYAETMRTKITNKNYPIGRTGPEPFDTLIKRFQKILVVSRTKYDPLFGYSGAPISILRKFYSDKMTNAYNSRETNLPAPGKRGRPLEVALSEFGEVEAESIEVVANSEGILAIFHDSIVKAFNAAVGHLCSISETHNQINCSSVIISASNEECLHETLLTSLNSLWNSIHLVRRNGSAVLFAENIKGIGEGVLRDFVEGRIEAEHALDGDRYIEGLEHLLYLRELQSHYDLGIMSTIPHYYVRRKLGLYPYAGSKEVLDRLMEKHGKHHKILVISDADTILIEPK